MPLESPSSNASLTAAMLFRKKTKASVSNIRVYRREEEGALRGRRLKMAFKYCL